jgi:hypothetical protein
MAFNFKDLSKQAHQQNNLFKKDDLEVTPATKKLFATGNAEGGTVVSNVEIMQAMYKAASTAYPTWQREQIQDVFAKTLDKVIADKGADQAPSGIVAASYNEQIHPAEEPTNAAADKKDKTNEAPTVTVRPE